MATTDRRFENLRFSAAGPRQFDRVKLILALLGFAALVAWGIVDKPDRLSSDQPNGARLSAEQQAAYDGHGKWGGYMAR